MGVQISVVVPREGVATSDFVDTLSLHDALPSYSGAVVVQHPHGSDDGDIAGTLDDDRTVIQTIVTDPFALIGYQRVGALQVSTDEHLDLAADCAYIAEAQLGVEVSIVVPREGVRRGQLVDWQSHQFRVARPVASIVIGDAHGSNDWAIPRALDFHRSTIYASITDSLALIGEYGVVCL